jgi:CelD/BcsL family acetyltransferase involved in cellulose biosynthesis
VEHDNSGLTGAKQARSADQGAASLAHGINPACHRHKGTSGPATERRAARTDSQDAFSSLLPDIRMGVEFVEPARLGEFEKPWLALLGEAVEGNPFYQPAFLIPCLHHLGEPDRILIALVWSETGRGRKLVGLFPLLRPRLSVGPKQLKGWINPFITNGTPLVDRNHVEEVLATLFVALCARMPKLTGLLFPGLDANGTIAQALARLSDARHGLMTRFDTRTRAVLYGRDAPGGMGEIDRKRLRENERLGRKLGMMGELRVRHVRDRLELRDAFEHFLALEASSWKGRRGTAMLQKPAVSAFARSAMRGLAAQGRLRIDLMELNDKVIAAGVVLSCGDVAAYWKTSYDPALASASPGYQLTIALTQEQWRDKRLRMTDSCAVQNHPMMDRLWQDRIEICDMQVSLTPENAPATLALALRERLQRSTRSQVKSLYRTFFGG